MTNRSTAIHRAVLPLAAAASLLSGSLTPNTLAAAGNVCSPAPHAVASGSDQPDQRGTDKPGADQNQDNYDEPSEDGTEVVPRVPAPGDSGGCQFQYGQPLELLV